MSKMTMQATVDDVQKRTVKENTPDERVIYDILDTDGTKWTAWEKPLAEQAFNLKGQPSLWKVEVKENGKWTNRTLIAIEALGTSSARQAIETMADNVGSFDGGTGTASNSSFDQSVRKAVVQEPDYKDRSICRQTAGKVAAQISTTPGEFWANVTDLARYFETGETPTQGASSAPPPASLMAESQKQATDPFVPVPDDDIPF